MKVTLFGATGRTGRPVAERALAAGHKVTALVRNPEALPAQKGLTVIQGDVLDPAAVEQAVAGADAVVSVLGVPDRRKPTTLFSEGVGNILKAMKPGGRLITLSADGVEPNPNVNIGQRLITALVVARILKHLYRDMLTMEATLADSDVEWTAIRPPRLSEKDHTGEYRTSVGDPISGSTGISRADLADYIVTHLADAETYRKLVWISY